MVHCSRGARNMCPLLAMRARLQLSRCYQSSSRMTTLLPLLVSKPAKDWLGRSPQVSHGFLGMSSHTTLASSVPLITNDRRLHGGRQRSSVVAAASSTSGYHTVVSQTKSAWSCWPISSRFHRLPYSCSLLQFRQRDTHTSLTVRL